MKSLPSCACFSIKWLLPYAESYVSNHVIGSICYWYVCVIFPPSQFYKGIPVQEDNNLCQTNRRRISVGGLRIVWTCVMILRAHNKEISAVYVDRRRTRRDHNGKVTTARRSLSSTLKLRRGELSNRIVVTIWNTPRWSKCNWRWWSKCWRQ
jgi:hypothetical protein